MREPRFIPPGRGTGHRATRRPAMRHWISFWVGRHGDKEEGRPDPSEV